MYVYVGTFVCCCHTRILVHACVSVYSRFVHMHVYTYACIYIYMIHISCIYIYMIHVLRNLCRFW
jgi:hypothetical protein